MPHCGYFFVSFDFAIVSLCVDYYHVTSIVVDSYGVKQYLYRMVLPAMIALK